MPPALKLTREQILAFRRRVSALAERLPMSAKSLQLAAWAGLQDSMPRAALLSIHARVADTPPSILDDPALVQVWGPRYSAYAIAAVDLPIFTLSRMPDTDKGRRRAEETADALERVLAGRSNEGPLGVRRTGRPSLFVALCHGHRAGTDSLGGCARADGVDGAAAARCLPLEARLEMARRYLRVFGANNRRRHSPSGQGFPILRASAAFEALGRRADRRHQTQPDGWIVAPLTSS